MRYGVFAEPIDLVRHPPGGAQLRRAAVVLALLAMLFALLVPVAGVPLSYAPEFMPIYLSTLIATNFVTGVLLLGHVHTRRSPALGILCLGYLFTALIAGAYMLTFPGLLGDDGVLGGSHQSAPWLHIAWHALYPLFVLGYTLSSRGRFAAVPLPPHFLRFGALLTALFVSLLVFVGTTGAPYLPPLLDGARTLPLYHWISAAVLVLSVGVLYATVRKRPRTVLDVWLTVAMAAWVFEVGLSCVFNAGLFDLGFYAGRLYGVAVSLFVLGALAIDNIALHARLHASFQEVLETRARAQWQSLLGSVLHQLPDGVLLVDAHGRCVLANEQATQMAGHFLPTAGARGAGPAGMADGVGAMLDLIREPVGRAVKGSAFRDAVIESVHGGARRVYSASGAPLRDGAAELACAVIVLDDITARTEASAALGRALDQTRYLIENTPLAVIEWNRDLVVTLWNRRAEELFGWSASEAIGQRVDRMGLIHEDDADQVNAMIARLVDCGVRYARSSNRNRTRDGAALCCEWYNSVLVDAAGEIETVFSLVLDVSEREQAMASLRDADSRKDVYIATLAHELRNPLAPIANAASLLRSKTLAPERIEWIASMVARQTHQMARLLDDLLDVSRIGRGKIELRRVRLELGRLMRETLQTSMPLIEAGRHQVVLRVADEPLWVDADPLRLTQVFANLITNAAKYTPPGGGLELGLRREGAQAVAWVSDTGVGLEAGMLARVFDPFVQVGSASHLAQGGLGIGLSLAKGFVELHGGVIAAASDGPGCGATFLVRLPLCEADAAGPDGVVASVGGEALNVHILIADDNVDAADSLAWLLRAEGATVMVAHDGAEALRLYRARPARIAVLDLGMPQMDGLELAAILAQATPCPYLVAVTGRGRQEDRNASLAAGFDQHLTKPVVPQQLLALLRAGTEPGPHSLP